MLNLLQQQQRQWQQQQQQNDQPQNYRGKIMLSEEKCHSSIHW
jgi:phosphoketolase